MLAGNRLACRRGQRTLFRGLDLELAPGSVTWLRGPNGIGKTSLLRMLAGLAPPEEGSVTWQGQPISRQRTTWHERLCYVGHGNALKDDLTLIEAVVFMARLLGRPASPAEVTRALQAVGLGRRIDDHVRTLSQGQRRRGALARLVLDDEPRTWVLDEPYDALDAAGVAWLDGAIAAHAARGGSVILTSHMAVNVPGLRELDLEPYATSGRAVQ